MLYVLYRSDKPVSLKNKLNCTPVRFVTLVPVNEMSFKMMLSFILKTSGLIVCVAVAGLNTIRTTVWEKFTFILQVKT